MSEISFIAGPGFSRAKNGLFMNCHYEGASAPEGSAVVPSLKGLGFVLEAYPGLTSWAMVVPSWQLTTDH